MKRTKTILILYSMISSYIHITNYGFSICKILSVLPASSVECERGFSKLNAIKTADRNRLKDEHLEALIRISTTQMDPRTLAKVHSQSLITTWKDMKTRRSINKEDVHMRD
jgi:hypothetical protein